MQNRPFGLKPAVPFVPGDLSRLDWTTWLRLLERKRRLLARLDSKPLPIEFLAALTHASFRLDSIDIAAPHLAHVLAPPRNALRSRITQRLRNHMSILRRIESARRAGESLQAPKVLRWYTSISCGLCAAAPDDSAMHRLDAIMARINSPQLRLQPAVTDIARLHVQLLGDPLFPSFNGILARLLLQYHLGRSGLPPILFDPVGDADLLAQENRLLERILHLVDATYNMLLT